MFCDNKKNFLISNCSNLPVNAAYQEQGPQMECQYQQNRCCPTCPDFPPRYPANTQQQTVHISSSGENNTKRHVQVLTFQKQVLFEGRLRVVSNFGDSDERHARTKNELPRGYASPHEESPKLETTRSLFWRKKTQTKMTYLAEI